MGIGNDELSDIITDVYNPPPEGRDERHHGVDFAYYRRGDQVSIEGTPTQAILAGRVSGIIGDRPPYGYTVILETRFEELPFGLASLLGIYPGNSLYHLYAHLAPDLPVSMGDTVEIGHVIGIIGRSQTIQPHLHLETRRSRSGAIFGAMAYYTTDSTIEERENYVYWRMSGTFEHFDPMILYTVYNYITGN
jgi:murein DD-endopeptidase MepM/ murein hydrolase activator NlpD